jgi:hypothetical protein
LTEIIKQTYRTNGISGFYRGAVPVVFGNALKAGTRFFTFEAIRDLLKDKETGKLTPAKNMLGKRVFLEHNYNSVTDASIVNSWNWSWLHRVYRRGYSLRKYQVSTFL